MQNYRILTCNLYLQNATYPLKLTVSIITILYKKLNMTLAKRSFLYNPKTVHWVRFQYCGRLYIRLRVIKYMLRLALRRCICLLWNSGRSLYSTQFSVKSEIVCYLKLTTNATKEGLYENDKPLGVTKRRIAFFHNTLIHIVGHSDSFPPGLSLLIIQRIGNKYTIGLDWSSSWSQTKQQWVNYKVISCALWTRLISEQHRIVPHLHDIWELSSWMRPFRTRGQTLNFESTRFNLSWQWLFWVSISACVCWSFLWISFTGHGAISHLPTLSRYRIVYTRVFAEKKQEEKRRKRGRGAQGEVVRGERGSKNMKSPLKKNETLNHSYSWPNPSFQVSHFSTQWSS